MIGCVRGVNGTTAASHADAEAVLCATLIVSETDHGALENDFVTFSDATALGGNITADILNQEYQITAQLSTTIAIKWKRVLFLQSTA